LFYFITALCNKGKWIICIPDHYHASFAVAADARGRSATATATA
jgi:hypothetical protein